MIARLRVGWTVAGCAFGVRMIASSVLFHWTTELTGWADVSAWLWAAAGSGAAARVPACVKALVPASASVIIVLRMKQSSPFFLSLKAN
jgi:hypothetical protein